MGYGYSQKTTVVTEIGRPPVLRVGHQSGDVLLQGLVVEFLELFSIIEVATERALSGIVLTQNVELQIIGPPVAYLSTAASDVGCLHGTLAFRHDCCGSSCVCSGKLSKTDTSEDGLGI